MNIEEIKRIMLSDSASMKSPSCLWLPRLKTSKTKIRNLGGNLAKTRTTAAGRCLVTSNVNLKITGSPAAKRAELTSRP
ncbi:hypothetical protein BC351_09275 [Paenibacillus ferrarius]|uniref:Uncharacterized protein n=1 Tax=Paenibacillus ferrarius TaxID=1469647 RepID=A0A1V4HAR5_9BACL|nr:hypothetical protein [Paenibacillus ferrarius]OPH48635.1 hypothetical protein BC351_09275 [Paenibacillus ferrarius]